MHRWILLLSTAGLCWPTLCITHEAGHVLHAWASGSTVEQVRLPIFAFSETVLGTNPHPRFVAWGGPVWGCLLPLLILVVMGKAGIPGWYVARFLAGFCLVANGVYIGIGPALPAGDSADLLRMGESRVFMMAFGVAAAAGGLALWHGLSRHFRAPERKVTAGAACVLTAALLLRPLFG